MPVIALCSWAAVTQNLDATSAHGVVLSNKCFSSVQYTAAARTLVGVCASQLLNAECDGSGKMLFLQNWISSFRSDGVVDVLGTRGGARRGETWPGGRTSCRVGGTAAARTTVNCANCFLLVFAVSGPFTSFLVLHTISWFFHSEVCAFVWGIFVRGLRIETFVRVLRSSRCRL